MKKIDFEKVIRTIITECIEPGEDFNPKEIIEVFDLRKDKTNIVIRVIHQMISENKIKMYETPKEFFYKRTNIDQSKDSLIKQLRKTNAELFDETERLKNNIEALRLKNKKEDKN